MLYFIYNFLSILYFMHRLTKDFFLQDTLSIAQKLIGKTFKFIYNNNDYEGIITETEGYFGDDSASHAAKGKTKRNEAMFLEGGISYVYMIYGIYHCLNFVTEKKDYPAAVLIRGLKLSNINLDGPGKLCKYLGISREHNKINICKGNIFQIYDNNYNPNYIATTRIGISKNIDKKWRFLIAN